MSKKAHRHRVIKKDIPEKSGISGKETVPPLGLLLYIMGDFV